MSQTANNQDVQARDMVTTPTKKPATVGIVLDFTHPSIDPAEITRRLKLRPSMSAVTGSHYRGVDGQQMRAIHPTSKWLRVQNLRVPALDNQALIRKLEAQLTKLEPEAKFVRKLSREGRASLGLQFAGLKHRGVRIPADLLARIYKLGLGFSIEVFPGGLSYGER